MSIPKDEQSTKVESEEGRHDIEDLVLNEQGNRLYEHVMPSSISSHASTDALLSPIFRVVMTYGYGTISSRLVLFIDNLSLTKMEPDRGEEFALEGVE